MDEAIIEVEALRKRAEKFDLNFKKCSQKNRTKGYLEGRISGLEELWKCICEADEKIESLKDDENKNDKYFLDDVFGKMEDKYYQLKGEIKDQLNQLEPQQQRNGNLNGNHNPNNGPNESKVKLPKISLPTFSGSYHTWISFKNRFTNLVHDNKSLSNVDKLEYLKSCVTDDAERAIQRFQITDQNYKAAWDRLNEKFDNKRILQDTQIETIIDRKEIKTETAKEIRDLLDVVQESLEALKNMDVDTGSWDPMLVVLVKRKLPFKTREEWEKQLETESVPTYAELSAFLEKRFRTVESLELVGTSSEAGSKIEMNNNTKKSIQRAKCPACNNNFHSLMKASVSKPGDSETLFPTAIIRFRSKGGTTYNLRALLDQCSEDVFIKESVAKMLGGVQFEISSFDVTGLQGVVTTRVEKSTSIQMVIENEVFDMNANIVPTLVGILPKTIVQWPRELFKNIKLADPHFATPNNVDIMLGTQAYTKILLEGVLKEGGYLAQNTKVGWIVSGKSEESATVAKSKRMFLCMNARREEQPDNILKKFWQMEEAPRRKKKLTNEEMKCEQSFKASYRRLCDGRPQVKLPFKENPSEYLGESRNQAVARWLAMERKLEKDENLKKDYMKAIKEHFDLGHLERVSTSEKEHKIVKEDGRVRYSCYYIPHHAVVKEESKTTKTRIVFDASAKTSSGKSLNEILMVGPTIQESLIIRLMKWRIHRFALRGDITKMYRQIKVYEEDVKFQRMVFRFNRTDPIEDFGLNTLTFGTASAPYMAMKTLKQVAIDGERKYPVGSKITKEDFHVDDLLTGADTVETVKTIWKEVKEMLAEAKFPMRKWSSNSNEVLRQIPEEEREFQAAEITMDDTLKALGIGWSPIEDYFFFKAPENDTSKALTKRKFLSQAAKLFDPLGWLGPVVLQPKIMFQKLWKAELKWDDEIPKELADEWIEFRNQLSQLEHIKIPRWLGWSKDLTIELHGFGDACEQAFGAVIYIKATNEVGNSTVELVLAKSRVAPVQTIRLPRLELCGAVLLADLMDTVKHELQVNTTYYWTDSTITLDWINSTPDKHKTFVANRIAEIQECTQPEQWRHVDGTQNPADCLSRGLNPKELLTHPLWWNGPQWLKLSKENWPKNPNVKIPEDLLELKGKKSFITRKVQINQVIKDLLSRYNSFTMLVRVAARIRTIKKRVKQKRLTVSELENERMYWIRIEQSLSFGEEINALKNCKELSSKSKLLQFNPFLDRNGVLRIGGRLKEAVIDYDSKHQIIIPKNSTLSRLIINDAHNITKHGGTQLTMTYTRTQYWIIDTRKAVRNQIHKCVICHRYSKRTQIQLMGNLPEPRVNMSRAFLHTGVDYAGPVQVLTRRRPGKREVTKGYVALFVCLCTKAIHLELVSNMTSESFLAAFTRFSGRRGLPSDMYSDNSKTFIGAKNELNEDLQVIKEVIEPKVAEIMLKSSVQWHFIPPHAPHWGGIWEAGVKSMKHHVRRVTGESVRTFEEITTMLVEIEAVLNSRPLCPVSNDPSDFSILTPGHFLIGEALLSPPRPSLLEVHPDSEYTTRSPKELNILLNGGKMSICQRFNIDPNG